MTNYTDYNPYRGRDPPSGQKTYAYVLDVLLPEVRNCCIPLLYLPLLN